jgi:cytochrome b involved in lipid metabolism
MAFEKRDMSGAIFKNDKATSDKAPGYTGYILINGTEYDLSAWLKEGKKGKFFSLSVKPKQTRQDDYTPPPEDSGLPF